MNSDLIPDFLQTGGKPVGRRLRFDLDYCREINAQIRGLPWPPVAEQVAASDCDLEYILRDDNSDIVNSVGETEDSLLSVNDRAMEETLTDSTLFHNLNESKAEFCAAFEAFPSQQPVSVLKDGLSDPILMETVTECRDETGQVPSETDNTNVLQQRFTTPLPRYPPPSANYFTDYESTSTNEQKSGVEPSPQGLFGGHTSIPNPLEIKPLSGDSPTTSKFIFSIIDDAEARLNHEGSSQHQCAHGNCSHRFVKVVQPPPPDYTPSAQGVAFGFDIQYPCDREVCGLPHVCVESPTILPF